MGEKISFYMDEHVPRAVVEGLRRRGVDHSGIVYARQQTSIGEMVRGLMLIYQVLDSDEMRNHVEFL